MRHIRLPSLLVSLATLGMLIILLLFPGDRFAGFVLLGLGVIGGLSWWRLQREDQSQK